METRDSSPIATYHLAENVTREVLPNGITLLIKENHNAPVVAILVSVRIGYFNEPDSVNGISHVIEHMLFKGTERRPGNEQIAQEVRELGGSLNAGTYYEETYYYVVVPSPRFEQAMDIQADAFQHPLFEENELRKEIEVIVQESLQKRDNPTAMLVESLYELAFDQHRIRRWRIGHPETLRAFTHETMEAFYNQTYFPDNITIAIVGDVDTAQARALTHRYWSQMEHGSYPRELSPDEPTRSEFRYRRLQGDTQQRLLMMAFQAPPILHPDAPALMVLSALLSDGRSARLFRRLKEEQRLVNSVWASYEGFEQMGLFTLGAETISDDPLPTECALWKEICRLQRELADSNELERIKTRVESRRLFAQEEVLGVARALSSYENLGDYRLTDIMLERLHAVTAEDVRRVAKEYFKLPHAALLEYLPATLELPDALTPLQIENALYDAEDTLGMGTVTEEPQAARIDLPPRPRVTHLRIEETAPAEVIPLPDGGTLFYKPRRDLPVIAISALVRGGRRNETPATSGISNLLLKSTLKGTRSYSAEEVANRIEGLGSSIGISLGPDYFGYGMKVRKDALQEAFPIFAEVIAHPSFPPEEVEREKQSIYAEIRRQQDNNFSLAYDLFCAACYGNAHPYGLPASGIAESVEAFTLDDLRAWHARHLIAQNLVVGIVGDISAEEAVALVADLLPRGASADPFSPPSVSPYVTDHAERTLERPKQQTATVIGFPGAAVMNEDRYALDVLSEITAGMGGRFFRTVRGENALAYQVTSFHRARLDAGNFVAYTSTAPENALRARDLLMAECELLTRELVSAKELDAAKSALFGEHVIGTQTFGAQAGELAGCAVYNLPPDEPQRYLARIQALTAEEIRDVARRYLTPERYWLGIVRGGVTP